MRGSFCVVYTCLNVYAVGAVEGLTSHLCCIRTIHHSNSKTCTSERRSLFVLVTSTVLELLYLIHIWACTRTCMCCLYMFECVCCRFCRGSHFSLMLYLLEQFTIQTQRLARLRGGVCLFWLHLQCWSCCTWYTFEHVHMY